MRQYISGFDYLRAFFAILVVVWHAQGISFLAEAAPSLQSAVNIFYYNICLLAVPVFFSISLFLFYKKQLNEQHSFPQERLANLLVLYSIWMVIGVVFNLLSTQGKYLAELATIKNVLATMVVGSRPELFFLFSLAFMSCLAFVNSRFLLNKRNSFWIQLALLILSLLVLLFVSFYTLTTSRSTFSAYWNPICFIPYVFSSSILALVDKHTKSDLSALLRRKKNLFLAFFLISLLLSWLEWQVLNNQIIFGGYLLPPYARVSLVIGAFLVCYFAILSNRKPPAFIYALSQESLGIYLLHGYILFLIGFAVGRLQSFQLPLGLIFNPVVKVIFAVALSVLLSKALKRYKIGRIMLNVRSK